MYVPSASGGAGAAVILMVAGVDLVVSVIEVAVTTTVVPVGICAGAVYVVLGLFPGVVVELKLPQDELLQVTDQVTPAAALSLLTMTDKLCDAPTTSDVGGVGLNVMEIPWGGVGPLPPPLQPAAATASKQKPTERIVLRDVIGLLLSQTCSACAFGLQGACEPKSRFRF